MREPTIDPRHLETWAGILLDHSLGGITPEDRVMIKGERICWPLMEVLERRVLQAGGIPDISLVPPNNDRGRLWSAAVVRHGAAAQWEQTPAWHRERYESMTKYIEVLGAEAPAAFAELTADQVKVLAATDRPFAAIRLAKPWVLTLYPTPGFAALEGMDLDEYVGFVVGASVVDPRPLRAAEERLAPLFREGKTLTVETRCPVEKRDLTLTMDITPSIPVLSYGLRNHPDGEIFTSPNAASVEGEIFLDLTVSYGGNDMAGIYLKFEEGRVTRHRAAVGADRLTAILETDPGARRLGEVALGMNPGLERVLKHPLFVEKVGGTLHVALGASYDNGYIEDPSSEEGQTLIAELQTSGVLNRSAQHVDIVADFRPGGCGRRVAIDGHDLIVRDGLWVPA